MKIKISDGEMIGDLKRKFNNRFPFLHIEFFTSADENSVPDPLNHIKDDTILLKSLRETHHDGVIIVSEEDKVGALEKLFRQKFGLFVQVFRKSGKQWLLTTATDGFTLKQQNELGEEMAKSIVAPEPEDIHEQE
jgi:hypothetical protein